MILVNSNRKIFQIFARNNICAEIGVYKGDYSHGLISQNPETLYLIDPWEPPPMADLVPADFYGDPQRSLIEAFEGSGYYNGGLSRALDQAFEKVKCEFQNHENVRIVRQPSSIATNEFQNDSLDFIYIDANHRYDFVLADLYRWSVKLKETGVIVLNDAYVSHIGKKQHISVLEAISSFTKLSDFRPVAMNNRQFADVLLTRSPNVDNINMQLLSELIRSDLEFLEIPDSLLHSAHHKLVKITKGQATEYKEYLSFS